MEPLLSEPSETRFRPTAPLTNLRRRAALYRELRSFFDEKGFVEVSTPALSRDVVVDRFVESIPVVVPRCWQERDDLASRRFDDPETSRRMVETFYLQTSPEFAMKRLVASGMDAIYQLAPAFRRGDCGKTHNVEFTMLEWYRTGDDYSAGRRFLADLVEILCIDIEQLVEHSREIGLGNEIEIALILEFSGNVLLCRVKINFHISLRIA